MKEKPKNAASSKEGGEQGPGAMSEGRGRNREERRRETRVKAHSKQGGGLTNWRETSAGEKMIETLRLLLERIREAGL